MKPKAKPRKTRFCLLFWLVGLSVPAGLVWFWDMAPRYQALRALKAAGLSPDTGTLHAAIDEGNIDVVSLLHAAKVPMGERDQRGRTPLTHAVVNRQILVLHFFVTKTDVDLAQPDARGIAPLAHAVNQGDLESVRLLLPRLRNPNIDICQSDAGSSIPVIVKAARDANIELLEMLLGHPRIDVHRTDKDGMTALHHAVRHREPDTLEELLTSPRRVKLDAENGAGETPLELAVLAGRLEAVKHLVDHGAELDSASAARLLSAAIANDDFETLRFLLRYGTDPEQFFLESQRSLLQYCIDEGKAACTLELLDAGVHSERVLREAIECGNQWIASLIVDQYASQAKTFDANQKGLLGSAIENGDMRAVHLLLDNGANPDQLASCGQRVLALALATGQQAAVSALLDAGAEAEFVLESPVSSVFVDLFNEGGLTQYCLKTDGGITPLMLACLAEDEFMARELLEHGAKRDHFTDVRKFYPINFASQRHNVRLMQLMLGRTPGDESRKLVVSLSEQRATLYQDGEIHARTKVSTGQKGFETPEGVYVITNKIRDHNSNLYRNAAMPFYMRLNCGDFGFHSGNVPGYPASHGCIRVPWREAKKLFAIMRIGDVAVIAE